MPFGHRDFERLYPCPDPCHSEQRLRSLAVVSGLHVNDLSLRLADFIVLDDVGEAVLRDARSFLDDPLPLWYLYGGPGNGKGQLAKALVNEFNERGLGALYATWSDVLQWIRETFGGDVESYSVRYQRLLDVPMLVVDEMDKVNLTGWAGEFRFAFLDARYNLGLHGERFTVMVSQLPPEELFPPSLASRCRDGRCRVTENLGKDLRPSLGRER